MGEPSLDDANVKVAVRLRPMNRRGEKASVCPDLDSYWYGASQISMDRQNLTQNLGITQNKFINDNDGWTESQILMSDSWIK